MRLRKAVKRLLDFGSALYLFGLFVYMTMAVRDGSVTIRSDTLMPYEIILVGLFVVYNAVRIFV